jgi:hypothetical protein
MNTDADMDFFELVLFDVLIVLIFVCFFLTAVFFTSNNLFIINLALIFGAITIPCARFFSGWWTYLRYHEREKAKKLGQLATRVIFFDFGLKGNTWMFRAISGVTAAFSFFNLIRYFIAHW